MTKVWGPCTWFLFHTLAEKIKEEEFSNTKHKLLSIILNICNNLPCPECAQHAKNKFGSLYVNNIRTKRDLQLMLLSFHNFVNQRTGKPQFTEEQLDDKYKKAITSHVIQYFLQIWQKPNSNPRMLTNSFHKGQVLKDFISWWNENHRLFIS